MNVSKYAADGSEGDEWDCSYWHGDYSVGGKGQFHQCFDMFWSWSPEESMSWNQLVALAEKVGALKFGDKDFGFSLHHETLEQQEGLITFLEIQQKEIEA
jgi:hypothetical protein